jgi:hypothetical protein
MLPLLPASLLLVHAATTWLLTGLIWFVHVVHYPLFARVGAAGWHAYHQGHTDRTSWVVILPMLVELGLACWLALAPTRGVPAWAAWLGLGLVLAVWAQTFQGAVPEHNLLARGHDLEAIARLVRGNALRTLLWTLRAALVFWMVQRAMTPVGG